MARRPGNIGRYGGFNVRIDGLQEMAEGAGLGAREIASVWRDIMRGPFGQEFLQELKARASDNIRTGYTLSRMGVHDSGTDGVTIGIPTDDTARHPASKYANARSVGIWLESGTRMHLIPTRVAPYNAMNINGRLVSRATHPGFRGTRPAYRTLTLFKKDFERVFVEQLDRRLAPRMGLV